jgi:hypothetical protein
VEINAIYPLTIIQCIGLTKNISLWIIRQLPTSAHAALYVLKYVNFFLHTKIVLLFFLYLQSIYRLTFTSSSQDGTTKTQSAGVNSLVQI